MSKDFFINGNKVLEFLFLTQIATTVQDSVSDIWLIIDLLI